MSYEFALCICDFAAVITCGYTNSYGCLISGPDSKGICLEGKKLFGCCLFGTNLSGLCLFGNDIAGCLCCYCQHPKECKLYVINQAELTQH